MLPYTKCTDSAPRISNDIIYILDLLKLSFIKHLGVFLSKGMHIAFTTQNCLSCLSAVLDIREHHPVLFPFLPHICNRMSRARKPFQNWTYLMAKSYCEIFWTEIAFLFCSISLFTLKKVILLNVFMLCMLVWVLALSSQHELLYIWF